MPRVHRLRASADATGSRVNRTFPPVNHQFPHTNRALPHATHPLPRVSRPLPSARLALAWFKTGASQFLATRLSVRGRSPSPQPSPAGRGSHAGRVSNPRDRADSRAGVEAPPSPSEGEGRGEGESVRSRVGSDFIFPLALQETELRPFKTRLMSATCNQHPHSTGKVSPFAHRCANLAHHEPR